MEKMTQYGEFGCIFSHIIIYAFKISHFLYVYKHNYIVSEEGSSIVLHIECLGGHVPSRIFLKRGTI